MEDRYLFKAREPITENGCRGTCLMMDMKMGEYL